MGRKMRPLSMTGADQGDFILFEAIGLDEDGSVLIFCGGTVSGAEKIKIL